MMYDELVKSLRELCEMTALCGDYICFECPYEEKCSNYKNGRLSAVYRQAADAIETIPRWIPVTERLPKEEEEEIYWCYTNMGIMCECRWTNNRWGLGESDKWGWNIMDVPQYQKVTHWMPLPEPPKERNSW